MQTAVYMYCSVITTVDTMSLEKLPKGDMYCNRSSHVRILERARAIGQLSGSCRRERKRVCTQRSAAP
jgi:hypothetical protein